MTADTSTPTKSKRRRRTPEEAREEILAAAEVLLVRVGPTGLQLKTIAAEAGLSYTNVHHHFGSVAEVQRSLVTRMLGSLTLKLNAVFETQSEDGPFEATEGIQAVYEIVGSERYAKLIAWLVLFADDDQLLGLSDPLAEIGKIVANRLALHIPPDVARKVAPAVIHHVAVAAVGEGLIGDVLRGALGHTEGSRDAQGEMLVALVQKYMDADA